MPADRAAAQPDVVSAPTFNGLSVAAVIANESVSGPGRQLGALAAAMRALGSDFRVIVLHRSGNPEPAYAEYLDGLGVPCVMVEDRGPLDVPGVARRIARLLRDWKTDVIQTHGYKATAAGWFLRRSREHRPWIGFFHGETHENLKARFYHRLDHAMLGSADRVVVMSLLQHARFARMGERARIIHNAVLPDPGSAGGDDTAAIAAAASGLDHPILGVIGRLSPEKGVDVFLDACKHLAAAGRPFSALIAGDGPDRAALEDQCRQLGLGQRVRFLGTVRRVSELYRLLDLLVIPSRSEGLPNVLLEALGAGLPIVATRVGAVPEVLTDEAAGVVVPAGRPAALADAIAPALAQARSPEAQAARAATVARFSVDHRVRTHISLYAEVLGRGSVGG
jgi:glycosyltransferase involved in cell wall biosynthesis